MTDRKKTRTRSRKSVGVFAFTLLVASGLAAHGAAAAERIFKTVDENGNVVFTDVPPREGERSETVDVEPTNTFQPEASATDQWIVDPEADPNADPDAEEAFQYRSLMITSPADDASVRENAGNVTISMQADPTLRTGHRIRLLVDGTREQEGQQLSFTLSNLERGTHSVQGQIIDESGAVLMSSNSSTFHLQRFSQLNAPGRPTPAPGRSN